MNLHLHSYFSALFLHFAVLSVQYVSMSWFQIWWSRYRVGQNWTILKASKSCIWRHADKKLIRRWDSERELSLRRHRTRTTKYNRLVHKFCHRSTRLCVRTQVYEIKWHNAVQRPLRRLSSFKVTDLVPIESSYTTSYWWLILTYLLSCTVSKLWLIIGQIFAKEREVPHFNALAGVIPCQYRHKCYIVKN